MIDAHTLSLFGPDLLPARTLPPLWLLAPRLLLMNWRKTNCALALSKRGANRIPGVVEYAGRRWVCSSATSSMAKGISEISLTELLPVGTLGEADPAELEARWSTGFYFGRVVEYRGESFEMGYATRFYPDDRPPCTSFTSRL